MLASLQDSLPKGIDYEILLADDGSTDGTRLWLCSISDPKIKVVLNEGNLGYARTCNRAARMAGGELLCLLNNDVLLEPGWLEPMVALLMSSSSVGLVGNVHVRTDDGSIDHAGVELGAEAQFHHRRSLPPVSCHEVLAVSGACVLVRRADFQAVGGFDERFLNGGEDIDLCLRLRAAGKKIVLARDSHIRHHVGLSRGRQVTERDLRNSRLLFQKWREEIKNELAKTWYGLLQKRVESYIGKVLNKTLLTALCLVSLMIAELMIRTEESYWARMLDNNDKVYADGFWPRRSISFLAKGKKFIRSIYLWGGNIASHVISRTIMRLFLE